MTILFTRVKILFCTRASLIFFLFLQGLLATSSSRKLLLYPFEKLSSSAPPNKYLTRSVWLATSIKRNVENIFDFKTQCDIQASLRGNAI